MEFGKGIQKGLKKILNYALKKFKLITTILQPNAKGKEAMEKNQNTANCTQYKKETSDHLSEKELTILRVNEYVNKFDPHSSKYEIRE